MLTFSCRWINCRKCFAQMRCLEEHAVTEHLSNDFLTDSIRGNDFKCAWLNCDYPPDYFSVNSATLVRHVKYHVFIEYLISRTQCLLPFPISCESSHISSHHIPFDFSCSCNFKTDFLLNLCEHLNSCNDGFSLCLKEHKMFPCPMCLSQFTCLNDLLSHVRLGYPDQIMNTFQSGFYCLWVGCVVSPNELKSTVDCFAHIESHLHSSSTCLWIGCPAPKNLNRAHLLLHGYSAICRNNSINSLQNSSALLRNCSEPEECSSVLSCKSTRAKWINSHLYSPHYDGLCCQWMGCELRFENPVEFATHIMSHVVKNGDRINTCLWTGCSSQPSRIDRHLRETHSVPKFLCPFCLLAVYTKRCDLIDHIGKL
ncbi:unnamed protein product [Hymenolepis diminuta]|uniref:C2H2-type domain-containing protein n=2 Tax=Hymenolepis diminuta TaxID=6216 RepID=A0A0R3SWU0_HYMDI|nr:unnamed protein product [Hymenolepis diminuta]